MTTSEEKTLAQVAVHRGFLTHEQMKACLHEQRILREEGRELSLPEIIRNQGHLSPERLDRLMSILDMTRKRPIRIGGKYDGVDILGKGGTGTVYLARDPSLNRFVAIKVLRQEFSENRNNIDRFTREAKILARLRHPNIVPVHEIGLHDECMYFVMDFIEGTSFDETILLSRCSQNDLLELLAQIARAVHEIHLQGIIHRDLKPSNIIVDRRSRPIIMDFGLARERNRVGKLTLDGSVIGTPHYMAPEQAEGKTADERADVYALGVMMYQILTGHLPFHAANEFELYAKKTSEDPPRPRTCGRHISADLEAICLKAMDRTLESRYPSAGDFADDLGRHLRGEPIKARPISPFRKISRAVKRHRLAAALVSTSVLTLLGTGIWVGTSALGRTSETRRLLEEAGRRMNQGELERAKQLYLQTQGLDPLNPEAARGLRRVEDSERHFQKELDEAVALMSREPDRAEAILKRLLELNPGNASAMRALARMDEIRKHLDDLRDIEGVLEVTLRKIEAFDEKIFLPPKAYDARALREALTTQIQKLEEITTKDVEVASRVFRVRAQALRRLGKLTDALRALDESIRLYETGRALYERAQVALAKYRRELAAVGVPSSQVLDRIGPWRERALADFKAALRVGFSGDWEIELARAFVEVVDNSCNGTPLTEVTCGERLKLLGEAFLDRGRYDEAVEAFERVRRIFLSDAESHAGHARALLCRAAANRKNTEACLSDVNQAAQSASQAILCEPSASYHLLRIRIVEAKVELDQQRGLDVTETLRSLEANVHEAIRLNPEDSSIRRDLAALSGRFGNPR